MTTNLFGTARRLELAFGKRPQQFVQGIVNLAESIMPMSAGKLWQKRQLFLEGLKIGLKTSKERAHPGELSIPGHAQQPAPA